jgi:hypothetical protein
MDSNEIDFYIKIEEEIKKEIKHNLQPNTNNNIIFVSEEKMKLLLEEFNVDTKDFEKEDRFTTIKENPYDEIERLKVELMVNYLIFIY